MVRVNVRNPLSCTASRASAAALVMLLLLLLSSSCHCHAKVSPTFYDHSCPKALKIIRSIINTAIARERRMAASLVRLHFHDCFVQGCDGSILLDNSSTISSEKFALQNNNSVRGFEVIDKAKSALEKVCPGVVSCADILAVAARDSSVYVGGPSWIVKLGRRDSTTASATLAANDLPRFTDSLPSLISLFQRKGLSARDMVALSGSHTIGQARCTTFRSRIYNGTDIDAGFARKRRLNCPATAPNGDGNLAPLDLVTPNSFDSNYFKNLLQKKGLLQSDQVLYGGQSTDAMVLEYSKNPYIFKSDFATAMVKMGDIELLTGSAGIIRKVCNRVN